MAKHYDEKKVLRELDRQGLQINFGNHQIVINPNKTIVGIHSWGKLDFLSKYCGWSVFTRKNNEDIADANAEKVNYKANKKAAKAKTKTKDTAENKDKGKDFIKRNSNKVVRNMFKTIKKSK